jgi:hypothetical protein
LGLTSNTCATGKLLLVDLNQVRSLADKVSVISGPGTGYRRHTGAAGLEYVLVVPLRWAIKATTELFTEKSEA